VTVFRLRDQRVDGPQGVGARQVPYGAGGRLCGGELPYGSSGALGTAGQERAFVDGWFLAAF